MTLLNVYIIKSCQHVVSLEYYFCKKIQHQLQGTDRLWQYTEFHPNRLICEKMDTKFFFYFSYNCDLEWRLRSSKLISKWRAWWSLLSSHIWKKLVCKCLNTRLLLLLLFCLQNHINRVLSLECPINGIKWVWGSSHHHTKFESNYLYTSECIPMLVFLQSVKQLLFPLLQKILLNSSLKMISLNCFITTSHFILIRWKMCKKMKPTGFATCWPCDPQVRSRSM